MSETDELRAMLDERGVEYETYVEPLTGFEHVKWNFSKHGSADFNVEFGSPWLTMHGEISGPAQAIEATLGRGECHDLAETPDYRDKTDFECSACGYEYSAIGGFGCDCGDEPDFRFCPNCGRRVVEVDE